MKTQHALLLCPMYAALSINLTLLDQPNNIISSFIVPKMFLISLFSNILSHVHATSYMPVFLDASQQLYISFMFFWPCMTKYLCNKNQLDALFIVSLFRQSVPSQPDQQTVNWKAQHVPIVVYKQYTSWWWTANMPETCRGWLTK